MNGGDTGSIKEMKALLRGRVSEQRGSIPAEQHRNSSQIACDHAAQWLQMENIRSMLIYVSFRSELDTKPLIETAWKAGINVYVPRCRREDRSLTLHLLKCWDELSVSTYGIPEPDPQRSPAVPESFMPEAVIMPGLAFDRNGGRLGYGGGYYDRLHARFTAQGRRGESPVWAGIGFEVQVVGRVPMGKMDAGPQVLITEQGVSETNKENNDGTDTF
ncbi:5-formyltetrahydrofolate cyclo-ligase [Paenibacillus sp.]|jgi:5-formyltetrahydrofolate cyclo-ligase|uniref:5-formyltetrahydrofolate cyclo-ligase n=1 Tax=Paenibacillus sp. TaxID=58172 RepID=UPI00281C3362|nr:5-formyltetrahydrofolate cyclo-ligase [Paenibacillus sp.]MDR0270360.1 5-formyltetrahydrofolate cyclo-ligase [Paenibacillus sp.]